VLLYLSIELRGGLNLRTVYADNYIADLEARLGGVAAGIHAGDIDTGLIGAVNPRLSG
jgi:hypothetical protein